MFVSNKFNIDFFTDNIISYINENWINKISIDIIENSCASVPNNTILIQEKSGKKLTF